MLFLAIDEGQLAPTVMDDIMATVRPGDNKSQVMKKVRKG